MARGAGYSFTTANVPTTPATTYLRVTVPAGTGGILVVSTVRVLQNSSGATVNEVGLQRCTTAGTGTISAGDRTSTREQTAANVVEFGRSFTADPTYTGIRLVYLSSGNMRDIFGLWRAPRPYAGIILYEGEHLGLHSTLQNGGNMGWTCQVAGPEASTQRRLARRPRRSGYFHHVQQYVDKPPTPALMRQLSLWTVMRAPGRPYRNTHSKPYASLYPPPSGTTVAATTATDSASWVAANASVLVTEAATTGVASWSASTPQASQVVQATSAVCAWSAANAAVLVNETATSPAASYSASAPAFTSVAAPAAPIITWSAAAAAFTQVASPAAPIITWSAANANVLVTMPATSAADSASWTAPAAAFRITTVITATSAASSWLAFDAAILVTETASSAACAWSSPAASALVVEAASAATVGWQAFAATIQIIAKPPAASDSASWSMPVASFTSAGGTLATTGLVSWSASDATIKITETASAASSGWLALAGTSSQTSFASVSASSWTASDATIRITSVATPAVCAWSAPAASFTRIAAPSVPVVAWSTPAAIIFVRVSAASAVAAWMAFDAATFQGEVATQTGQTDSPTPMGPSGANGSSLDPDGLVIIGFRGAGGLDVNSPRGIG